MVDHIADILTKEGWTNGILSSYDGYVRNLGEAEGLSQENREASVVGTETARSIVILQASPRSEMDSAWFYCYEDGEMRVPYIDPADGLCKAAAEKIIGYSKKAGAAEILMALWDYYVAEEADPGKLEKLPEDIKYLQ